MVLELIRNACPFCGGDLFPGYKGRENSYKCVKCHRWVVGELKKEESAGLKNSTVGRGIIKKEEKGMSNGEWEEKVAGKVTFDKEGMEIIGRITDIKDTELGVKSYSLLDDEGNLLSFLGTTVLDRCLSTELNSRVRIIYTGQVRTGRGFQVKQFRIFTWKEEAITQPSLPIVEEEKEPASSKKK